MNKQVISSIVQVSRPEGLSEQQYNALLRFTPKGLEAMSKVTPISEIPTEMTEVEKRVVEDLFQRRVSIAVKRFCRQLREQKMLEGDQVPVAMVLDSAKVKGATLVASDKEVTVTDAESTISVPVSRVPVHPSLHAEKKIPIGLDTVALTIGASTRWTGKEVTVTLPMETLKRFQFVHLSPDAIKDVVTDIPRPDNLTGLRGRRWAYEVYTQLSRLEPVAFYTFASDWYESLYNLPPPTSPLSQAKAEVFAVTALPNGRKVWVPRDGFSKLSTFRAIRGGFPTVTTLPDIYAQYSEFASVQQGEGSGIGMVATPVGSWGLVGPTQVTCERLTAFIVAHPAKKIVLSGLSYADVMWIHHSVQNIRSEQVVYDLVSVVDAAEAVWKTDSVDGALFIRVGPTQLHASISANKINAVKVYDPAVVLPRVWGMVTEFLDRQDRAAQKAYYGAFLPPTDLQGYQLIAMHNLIWNSTGFVLKADAKVMVSRFSYSSTENKVVRTNVAPSSTFKTGSVFSITDPKVWYAQFTLSMNATMTFWGAPPVNNDYAYFNHMAPYANSGRYRVRQAYNSNEDDYYVAYDDISTQAHMEVHTTSATTPVINSDPVQQAPALVQAQVLDFGDLGLGW